MLPREEGGVVDANLRVYGLANVRIADASVPPMSLSTHLMASTYGVAEQAANIIRGSWNREFSTQPAFSSSSPSALNITKGLGSSTSTQRRKSASGNGSAPSLRVWTSLLIVFVHLAFALNLSL